ncbi:hypothetical protein CLV78_10979 [Aliiruegeria haliotis]|uniref:Uncharacterized protein n=1 Tax=Aliiruegeria haliotis TaxID=1280846 RepID=A0A2T0RJV4_9RHOB|nr:hypothetical protein CLV78_10979 [Aliiruegeria haliotis]
MAGWDRAFYDWKGTFHGIITRGQSKRSPVLALLSRRSVSVVALVIPKRRTER